ncbi:MAG: hypothetical protein ACXWQQ_13635 [Pseudobdellovibrio sp.]
MMMQNNYVLYADLDIQGNSQVTGLVDRTIRLFATGSSGLTCGIKKSGLQAIIPEANWDRLPITKINKSDLKEFIALFSIVQSSTGDKNQLVIERYLNATQGDDVVRTHSRYLDFITILEMVFVPDGKSGEIAHKLKMRASCVLATLLGTSKQDLSAKIKHIYKKRSDIVHSGTMAEMIPQDWYELAEICRLAVCEYLRSPASFTADRLDNAVLA